MSRSRNSHIRLPRKRHLAADRLSLAGLEAGDRQAAEGYHRLLAGDDLHGLDGLFQIFLLAGRLAHAHVDDDLLPPRQRVTVARTNSWPGRENLLQVMLCRRGVGMISGSAFSFSPFSFSFSPLAGFSPFAGLSPLVGFLALGLLFSLWAVLSAFSPWAAFQPWAGFSAFSLGAGRGLLTSATGLALPGSGMVVLYFAHDLLPLRGVHITDALHDAYLPTLFPALSVFGGSDDAVGGAALLAVALLAAVGQERAPTRVAALHAWQTRSTLHIGIGISFESRPPCGLLLAAADVLVHAVHALHHQLAGAAVGRAAPSRVSRGRRR